MVDEDTKTDEPISYIDWLTNLLKEDRANGLGSFVDRTRNQKYRLYLKYVKEYEKVNNK